MEISKKPCLNPEAETVAAWAYHRLLNDEKTPFPFTGIDVKAPHMGGGVKLIPREKPRRIRRLKPLNYNETCVSISKLICKLDHVANQFERLLKCGDFAHQFTALAFVSEAGSAVGRFNKLLLQLAEMPDSFLAREAVARLAFHSLKSANELEKLSRRNLEVVKPIAKLWGTFPVAYSPHKDRKRELEKLAENLCIGSNAPENVWNQRASFGDNQSALGIYAIRAMQSVLRPIRDGSPLRGRLLTEVRGGMLRSMDTVPLTKEERRLLIARGWPAWILDTVDLPPITQGTARLWAKAGWAALKEAAGNDLTSIPELAAKGESNARYAQSRATTKKGKTGNQKSRKETQIQKLFIKSFISRFGSQSVTPLAS